MLPALLQRRARGSLGTAGAPGRGGALGSVLSHLQDGPCLLCDQKTYVSRVKGSESIKSKSSAGSGGQDLAVTADGKRDLMVAGLSR